MNNWGLTKGDQWNPAGWDKALEILARRDEIALTETYEVPNKVDGWRKLTVQAIKAINPSARVYRMYPLMCKGDWDSDWNNPQDTRFMQFPIPKAELDAKDWWLRDGNGEIVKESSHQWLLDVGKPGYKEAYLEAVLSRNRGKGFDGFVFDYWWPEISSWLKGAPRPAAYPTDADWFEKAWKPFITYVMDGLHRAGYRVVGNCVGEFGDTTPEQEFQRGKVDAAIYEQGAINWWRDGSGWIPGRVIERRINAINKDPLEVWVANNGLRDYIEDYDRKKVVALAMYYVAIPQVGARRSYHHPYDWTVYWEPLWDFYIGEPAEPAAVKLAGKYFWSRRYTQGLVLLNYEESESITYTLDRTYVDPDGKVLSGNVVLPAHSAMILRTESR